MSKAWRAIRGYLFWTYDRGSIHYDVMVTLILVFIFLAPRWINFKDKPVEHTPHQTEVVVTPSNEGGLICQVEASAVDASDDASIRESLLRVIEPIAGAVEVVRYEAVRDRSGRIVSYKVWVQHS